MKKKSLVLAAAMAACMTSFAFATPQTTFEQGQAQVDLGLWNVKAASNTDASMNSIGNIIFNNGKTEMSTDSKWNFHGGVTYGLTDKWAAQYHYYGLKTKVSDSDINGSQHELNLLYSLNPNIAAYAGWSRINSSDLDFTNNIAQIGVVGKTQLTDKFDLYGKLAVGTRKTSLWEAGVGYQITKDLDLNAGYRSLNTKRTDDNNITYKGFIAGLAYKFGGAKTEAAADTTPAATEPVTPVVAEPTTPAVAAPVVKNDYYFDSIHFDFDQDQPMSNQRAKLDNFVKVAKENPNNVFKLVGNTDGKGDDSYNQDLSRRRVESVARYAENAGVPATQLKEMYRGKTDPVNSNDTDQGRADNRRVDIYMNK